MISEKILRSDNVKWYAYVCDTYDDISKDLRKSIFKDYKDGYVIVLQTPYSHIILDFDFEKISFSDFNMWLDTWSWLEIVEEQIEEEYPYISTSNGGVLS